MNACSDPGAAVSSWSGPLEAEMTMRHNQLWLLLQAQGGTGAREEDSILADSGGAWRGQCCVTSLLGMAKPLPIVLLPSVSVSVWFLSASPCGLLSVDPVCV